MGAACGKQPITPRRKMKSLDILIIRSYVLEKNQELKQQDKTLRNSGVLEHVTFFVLSLILTLLF